MSGGVGNCSPLPDSAPYPPISGLCSLVIILFVTIYGNMVVYADKMAVKVVSISCAVQYIKCQYEFRY